MTRRSPAATRAANDGADATEIACEQFDDRAGFPKRASVQHMRRLAFGGTGHGALAVAEPLHGLGAVAPTRRHLHPQMQGDWARRGLFLAKGKPLALPG